MNSNESGTSRVRATRDAKGIFHNPWPDSEPRKLGDVLKWVFDRRRRTRAPDPQPESFPRMMPEVGRPRRSVDAFTATWIGHSTVLMQAAGVNIITDPVFSERASPVQWAGPKRFMKPALRIDELPPIDVVLLSHSHYDHLDEHSIREIARRNPGAAWIVPLELGSIIRPWGAGAVLELDWWQSATAKGVKVTATPARHFSARGINDRNETLWSGFAIEAGGRRAYFAGDTAFHPHFSQVGDACGPFDLIMMPIGAYDPRWFMNVVHMDPEEAVQAVVDIKSTHDSARTPLTLGIHWGTFRLTDEAMDEPPRRAVVAWDQHGLEADRLWIAAFGETRSW